MENCVVPNCKRKADKRLRSPYSAEYKFWRKILKISFKRFTVCDQHSTIICQSCMKSFDSNQFIKTGAMFVVTEEFGEMFVDVIGYEIPSGAVCAKCHNSVADFITFRNEVRTQHELKSTMSNYSSISHKEHADDDNEDSHYEVVEYPDEAYEYYEGDEANDLDIKEECVDDPYTGSDETADQVEYAADDGCSIGIDSSASNSNNQPENSESIIKVEPLEYEYSDLEYQIPSDDLQNAIESEAHYLPKISNPRSIPNLKRKISNPDTPNSSITSSVQASLRSALESTLESSRVVQTAVKRMKFPQRSLKCQYCPQRFDNCDLILEHIENNHKFQCLICNTSFPFKINLIQHQFAEHKESSKEPNKKNQVIYKYPCGHCQVKFATSEKLEIHMKQEHSAQLKGLRVDEDKTPASLSSRILNSFKKAKAGSSGIINIKKES
ncbi:serendipity locus protein delta-like [Chironomus tepperi]|uniref:serendipity locus protein delta-like n=1 Tax=Chironomus tepperi TaxID=113505 RepID=UPI00391F61F3